MRMPDNAPHLDQDRPPVPVLDYAPVTQTERPSLCAQSVTRMLFLSIVFHLAIFLLYAPALDCGIRAAHCVEVSVGYWLVAAIVLIRRRYKPTWPDLLYLGFGYPLMLAICEWFTSR